MKKSHQAIPTTTLYVLPCGLLRNPDFPDREDLYRYKNFAGLRQVAEETHSTSASLTMKAEVEEASMFAAMPFSLNIA